MNPKTWFFCSWSGDFRLTRHPKDSKKCVLSVEKPTEREVEILQKFLSLLSEQNWVKPCPILRGQTTFLPIQASMNLVAPLLAAQMHGNVETWTAVRSEAGKIYVEQGVPLVPKDQESGPQKGGEVVAFPETSNSDPSPTPAEPAAEEPATEEPAAAVTVRAPVRGCPLPERCNHRASEALAAFLTRRQWAQWEAERRIRCIGHATGRAYDIYHRDRAAQLGLSRCIVETATGSPVCAWDATVPAEEEVLSLKLAIEHREKWLLGLIGQEAHKAFR
jgi:hypothetical protein